MDLFGTYSKRIKLTIDSSKVDADVIWFPVTVFFTDSQGEEVFSELDVVTDYMKCAFTKADGVTELYAEMELYNFYVFQSQYPPAQSDTYVKSTTKWSTSYWAYFGTDPTLSLTGTRVSNSWLDDGSVADQRFHIDLGSAKIINRIYYENGHHEGGFTQSGVQNFTFWGSNTGAGTFDDLVYANDEGWTELDVSQNTFDEHVGSDIADPKYITVTDSTASYRYYAFKFADNYGDVNQMGVRRIELQTEVLDPKAIYHVSRDGWTISSSVDTPFYFYYDHLADNNTTYIGAIDTAAGKSVWDGDYLAVYHMVDASTTAVKNSTSNSYDMTKKAIIQPEEEIGKIGQGQLFDGVGSYLVQASLLDTIPAALTLESVSKITAKTTVNQTIMTKYNLADTDRMYIFCLDNNTQRFDFETNNGGYKNVAFDDNWVLDTYQYLAVSWDTTNGILLFKDGASNGSDGAETTLPQNGTLNNFTVGFEPQSAVFPFDGIIDETRISSTARIGSWIKATSNSLWDTLLTYGSEETGGFIPQIIMLL